MYIGKMFLFPRNEKNAKPDRQLGTAAENKYRTDLNIIIHGSIGHLFLYEFN